MIVAAIWAEHPLHSAAKGWLLRSRTGEIDAVLCQHSMMEAFASLTGMPSKPRLGPAVVNAALTEALKTVEIIELSASDYRSCLDRADRLGCSGGITNDLLILHASEKARVDVLVTANVRHFLRLWEGDPGFIKSL